MASRRGGRTSRRVYRARLRWTCAEAAWDCCCSLPVVNITLTSCGGRRQRAGDDAERMRCCAYLSARHYALSAYICHFAADEKSAAPYNHMRFNVLPAPSQLTRLSFSPGWQGWTVGRCDRGRRWRGGYRANMAYRERRCATSRALSKAPFFMYS